MTVIAWDGKTLAADKRSNYSRVISVVTKIHKHENMLFGIVGGLAAGQAMLAWAKGGFVVADFPATQKNEDDWCQFVVVDKEGFKVYEKSPYPILFEGPFCAEGCGKLSALTAMHLGKSAKEAVEITSLFDTGCGNGVDCLTLDDEDEGWIEWGGGAMPESLTSCVEVILRDGATIEGRIINFCWHHDGGDGDIVKYRVIEPKGDSNG